MVDISPSLTTNWTQAARYADHLPPGFGNQDQQRLASYDVYDSIYWSDTEAFKVAFEDSDANPIYAPVGKAIVEAINRYLAVSWTFSVDPAAGNDADRKGITQLFTALFKRENLLSRFAQQKRWGLVRGDAIWHVTANPRKRQGSRVAVKPVDPRNWFPILADQDDDDIDRVVGVHLVDFVYDEKTKTDVVRRQTYELVEQEDGTNRVESSLGVYDAQKWDDRDGDPTVLIRWVREPELLPEEITQLPVYQIPTVQVPGDPYGVSVLRGLERLQEGVNQTLTDEDLAVALNGLGVFVTDSSSPIDPTTKEPVPWSVAPGRVIELDAPGAKFERVSGITSVEPSRQHSDAIERYMREGASVPSIALGDVDVQAAESGIALFLRLQPLLAANAERETEMLGRYDQMFYDLQNMWFPAYEEASYPSAVVTAEVGDPLPENASQTFQDVVTMVREGIMSKQTARVSLSDRFEFADDEQALISDETSRAAEASDPLGVRAARELEGKDDEGDDAGDDAGDGAGAA